VNVTGKVIPSNERLTLKSISSPELSVQVSCILSIACGLAARLVGALGGGGARVVADTTLENPDEPAPLAA